MKLNFELPTPNACVDCRFHYVSSAERYGGWSMQCLIDQSIRMTVSEGVRRRNEKCPGIVEKSEDA